LKPAVASPAPSLGKPVDRLLALYAVVGGAALLFPNRPGPWIWLALLHAAAVIAGTAARPAARVWSAITRAIPAASVFAEVYPLLLIPFLYAELPFLNRAVWNGRYFDSIMLDAEQAFFGLQPSQAWAQAMPVLPLSELLHAFYLSYYFIIFVPPLVILARRGRDAFRDAVFALLLSFVLHYVFCIYLPVQGPRYIFPAPGGAIGEGAVYQLVHRVLEAGSSQGAAFPSSHVGVAFTQIFVCWRHARRLTPVIAMLAVGLAAGAVYGGFHYAIDAIAGAVLGVLAAVAAPGVQRVLTRGR